MENQKAEKQATGRLRVSTSKILERLEAEHKKAANKQKYRIQRFDIPKQEFMGLLQINGSILMKNSGENTEFQYDPNVLKVANQLYFYTVGASEFVGNLDKGIALIGRIGCGKTVIMSAYIKLINDILEMKDGCGDVIFATSPYRYKTSHELYRQYNHEAFGEDMPSKLLIDEVGREPKISKSFGKEASPVTEILFERHRRGLLTHIVANFTLKDLSAPEMYGPILGDRLNQMFNFIEMKGNSLRR